MTAITLTLEQAQRFADAESGQPVVLVIEGDKCPACFGLGSSRMTISAIRGRRKIPCGHCGGSGLVEPVGWRVPAGEPVELRAMNVRYEPGRFIGYDGSVLVARATVELLPVVTGEPADWPRQPVAWLHPNGSLLALDYTGEGYVRYTSAFVMTDWFDPLPVPGRHWVAICTPETTP